ncbi:DUF5686 and carboxypeptidase regulatory-like domain-containing protein [Costertonia aggregata]|uniref:Carboxypeptidase-like regulatory domain-containing protein n=1 Tax=Costertonia aggregata TaxID=343403 RepID=A0A7H9AJP2_9FLAO|nr:DUF5686 and carboxypeptidase regulatory-like domain-containing protein [Costertonia aggregata]QLG43831.1 carboxypeptidase-like regulatory domain-containing protein [Costertonia aggregata]
MDKTKYLFAFLSLFSFQLVKAQIQGEVTDVNGKPLSFVNIYLEGSTTGTTSNDDGFYKLNVDEVGTFTIVFKYLGYTTQKKTLDIKAFPTLLNIVLEEETVTLDAVDVNASENPANSIIRNAIAKRKQYLKKIEAYTADFYSKGLIKIKEAPEKILGQDLGDFGGGLDSTRSGIIYLSETISKIAKNKKEYKETIVASKVSGDDNGFSFNNASDVDFSYYKNTIALGNQLISPIADNAFSYYRYKLLGTFYDDNKNLINQIQVIPKRAKDKVFTGTIYIVEDQWAIYATDLSVTGEQAQLLAVDSLFIKQSFNYSTTDSIWVKVLQSIDFQYGFFGIKGDGRFTAGYKNYSFEPNFDKKTFGNAVVSFEKEANKKDSVFWNGVRPVPLTLEENIDYTVKDSVQVIRKSQKYLDSVDRKENKFKLSSLLFGYTYSNTFKKRFYTLESPLGKTWFNTVQGWHSGIGLDYLTYDEEKGTRFNINGSFDYGFSDHVFRPLGEISYRFNNFSRPYLQVRGGNELLQFNNNNPITTFGNTIASLFFENNFAKFYSKTFASIFYSEEITNGIYLFSDIAYEDRKPVFNTTDYVIFGDNDDPYLSNNPLDPLDFTNAAIDEHTIFKFNLNARIRFGQKYLDYPDGKFNLFSNKYPVLFLGYEKGFAANNPAYNYDQLKIRVTQNLTFADKGEFSYNLRAGTFLNADDISFVDYQHFNGNGTRITWGDRYMNSFLLLPYYNFSTNKNYIEAHTEYNFKGFIMGKIPLLNKLNSNLLLTGKLLSTSNNQPYSEFGIGLGNLGWKKFRFFRIGYAQNHFNGEVFKSYNLGLQFN